MLPEFSKGRRGSTESMNQSPIKKLLRSLRLSIGHRKPAKTSAVGNNKIQRTTSASNRRSGTITRDRKTGVSSPQEPVLIKEISPRAVVIERPSTPQNQLSQSQERFSSTTSTPLTSQSYRSSPSSRLAFTRSQRTPSQQRVIRIPDSHHRRGGSATYVQEGRNQDAGASPGEVSRGRRSEQLSASRTTLRQAEDRTPSPPALDRTPSGTPCSSVSDEPVTPELTRRDLRIDTKPTVPVAAGMLSSLPEVAEDTQEVPASDDDVFDSPEDFYRLPSSSYYGAKATIPNQKDSYENNEDMTNYKSDSTKNILPDGSQLHNVSTRKPRLARPTSTMSTIPIIDQTSPLYPPASFPWPIAQETGTIPIRLAPAEPQQPAFRIPQVYPPPPPPPPFRIPQAYPPTANSIPVPNMIEVNKSHDLIPGLNILQRKPVSYERLRPVSASPHGALPALPEQMPPHRRTRSDGPTPTRPPPPRNPARSTTTYSYTPTRDTRADRRSYNTVRFLDSQGQNHERLRQVLGI